VSSPNDVFFDPGYDPSGDLDVVHERIAVTPPALPKYTIPSTMLPPVGMQGTPAHLGAPGSCAAWASTYGLATAAAARAGKYDPSATDQQASPAFIYIQVINVSETPCKGSSLSSYFNILASSGTPNLANAPYYPDCATLISDYHDSKNPPPNDPNFVLKKKPKAVSADDAASIQSALADNRPVAYGTRLYTDFPEYDGTPVPYVGNGDVIVSKKKNKPAGHCMMIIGYDNTMPYPDKSGVIKLGAYLIQNSFGTGWGANGYIWMAYETFLALAQCTCFIY
jgi:C1A family cysteine protease